MTALEDKSLYGSSYEPVKTFPSTHLNFTHRDSSITSFLLKLKDVHASPGRYIHQVGRDTSILFRIGKTLKILPELLDTT